MRRPVAVALVCALVAGSVENARLLACGPFPPVGVRFGTFYRLTPLQDAWGWDLNLGYLHRFDEVLAESYRDAASRTAPRRILVADLDAARRVEQSGDVATAAGRFDEIAKKARLAEREHRPSGDVITYALRIASDRVDLYRHAGVDTEVLLAYAEARDLYDQGETEKAKAALPALRQRAAAALPDQVLYLEGAIAWREGRLPDARTAFEKIAREMPTSIKAAPALYCLARVSEAAHRDGDAAAQLADLVERFPRHDLADDALGELGAIARRRGDVASAIGVYDRIRNQYPDGDMAERARESLLALGAEALAALAAPDVPRATRKALEPSAPFYRAYQALAPKDAPTAAPAVLDAAIAGLEQAATGTFLPAEARYRIGALLAAAGQPDRAVQAFGALAGAPDPSLRCRALFMQGVLSQDPSLRETAFRTILDAYPIHSTADDALFFLGAHDQEGVDMLRRVVQAYPHRDRIVSAAQAVIGASSGDVSEQVAEVLRSAGHEDRLLFSRSAAQSYVGLMARYPESPFALDGFFRQCYLSARHREELLSYAVPSQWTWAGRVSALHADDAGGAGDAAETGSAEGGDDGAAQYRRQQEADAVADARALIKFGKAFVAAPGSAEARKLVELKLPMAFYLAGQVQDAAARAEDVGRKYGSDPFADEAAIVSVLALADLGRADDALAAARGFVTRFPGSYFTSLAREREAILLEDSGRRVDAFLAYVDMGYEVDARYFVDVLLTDDELGAFVRDHPDHPWTGVVRHAIAVRALRAGDSARAQAAFEAAAPQPGTVIPPPTPAAPWDTWDETTSLGPVTLPPAPAPREEEIARDAAAKLDVVKRLADLDVQASAAATDDDRAEAIYQQGAFLYKHDLAMYDEAVWVFDRVESLKFLSMRSESEAKQFLAYLLRHNAKLLARARFQDVVARFPQSAAAPKALYMEARCDEYLNGYSSLDHAWLGGIGKETVGKLVALADGYPDSTLADDALYWAGFLSPDPEEQARLWQRLRDTYPAGDAIGKLDGTTAPDGVGLAPSP